MSDGQEYVNEAIASYVTPEWEEPKNSPYRVRVWMEREYLYGTSTEDFFGYTIRAADLPGCVSEGDTEDKARANLREAFTGVVLACREAGEPIPWENGGPKPRYCEEEILTIEVPEEDL